MLGKCQEAEDIGQETFIRFYRNLDKFRGESKLGTYLTRIAINLSLNELKSRKRKRWLFPAMDEDEESKLGYNDESFEKNEKREIIQKALKKLKPEFRSVIILRLISGYSVEETAKILNIPAGTVFSRLARAQKKLGDILKPYYKEEQ